MQWHCSIRDAKPLQRWNEFVENGEIQGVSSSQGIVQDSYSVQIFLCLSCNFIFKIECKKHKRRLMLFEWFC